MTDLRCYLVTSGTGPRTVARARAVAAAGAGVVQVRSPEASAAELLELVVAVAQAVSTASPGCRVLVDDRADVAAAARRRGASVHGVHLGQADLPVADARALLGPGAIVGLTAGTPGLVAEAEARRGPDRPDYLGAGPFRPTPTKDVGRPPVGLLGYAALVAATRLPVVAIGDVTPADVPLLAGSGVAGTALVRALMDLPDDETAARRTRECLACWPASAPR